MAYIRAILKRLIKQKKIMRSMLQVCKITVIRKLQIIILNIAILKYKKNVGTIKICNPFVSFHFRKRFDWIIAETKYKYRISNNE